MLTLKGARHWQERYTHKHYDKLGLNTRIEDQPQIRVQQVCMKWIHFIVDNALVVNSTTLLEQELSLIRSLSGPITKHVQNWGPEKLTTN